jgi:hypothetical protein
MVKPLMYQIWVDEPLRDEMQAYFGVHWDSIDRYISWLAEPDEKHSTKSMALVEWFGLTQLSGT